MRVAVFGAGAVGCLIAARLERAGTPVGLLARGGQLEAIRADGLTLIPTAGDRATLRPRVSGDPGELGVQDLVLVCLKAHTIAAAAAAIAALCHETTTVVPVMNGVPWWYHFRGPRAPGEPIESVDPGGVLWRRLPPDAVVGCVTHVACEVVEPGVVRHAAGELFFLGEPDGSDSERLAGTVGALAAGGFDARATRDIRREIWLKLWGNSVLNPIAALTGATADRICADPRVCDLVRAMLREGAAIAAALGVDLDMDVEARIDMVRELGVFKFSTLQDIERGRSIELEALLGAVLELARDAGVRAPTMEAVYALTRLRAELLGCYAG